MDIELRKKLTISADDYGIRETSKSILELAEKGNLDRVAVFAELVTDDDMQALLKTRVAIDIHLELMHLLKSGYEDSGTAFGRGINFLVRRIFGRVNKEKARVEWRRQIVLFQNRFGRLPDGLNSHEHVHYFPEFFSVIAELAKEFGIEYVRLGRNGIIRGTRGRLTAGILTYCVRSDGKFLSENGRESSDFVTSFDWFSGQDEFLNIVGKPEYSNIEVVFHPERPDERRVLESW
jgi:predicted glycoside hydrolase/deacetylase ChbG (UPF0249 family)